MKSYLPLCLLVILGSMTAVSAQDAPAAGAPPAQPSMLDRAMTAANLTADEKAKYTAAHDKAFASNPDLKTEDDALKKEGMALKANPDATADDKKAFGVKRKAHQDKVKAAILAADPSVQPIQDKIDKAIADLRAKRAAQQAASGGGQ